MDLGTCKRTEHVSLVCPINKISDSEFKLSAVVNIFRNMKRDGQTDKRAERDREVYTVKPRSFVPGCIVLWDSFSFCGH